MLQPNGLYWLGFLSAGVILLCALLHFRGLKNPLRGSGGLHRAKSLLKKCARGLCRWHGAAVTVVLLLGTGILFALNSFGVLSNPYLPFGFLSGGLCALIPQMLDLRYMPRWAASGAATMEVSPRKGLTLLTKASRARALTTVGITLLELTSWVCFLSYGARCTPAELSGVLVTLGLGGSMVTLLSRHLGLFSVATHLGSQCLVDNGKTLTVTDTRNPASVARALGTCLHQPAASSAAAWRCLTAAACAVGALTCSDLHLESQAVFYPLLLAWAAPLLSMLPALRGMPPGEHWDTRDLPPHFLRELRLTLLLTAAVGLPFSFLLFGSFRPWLAFVLGQIAAPAAIQISQLSAKLKAMNKEGKKRPALAYLSMLPVWLLPLLLLTVALLGAYALCDGAPNGLYGLALAGIGFLTPTADLLTASSFSLMARGALSLTWMSGDMTEPTWAKDLSILSDQFSALGRSCTLITELTAAGLLLLAWFRRHGLTLTLSSKLGWGIALGLLLTVGVVSLLLWGVKRASAALWREVEHQAPEIKGLHAGKTAPNTSACVDVATLSSLLWIAAVLLCALALPLLTGLLLGETGLLGMALTVLALAAAGGTLLITAGEHWTGTCLEKSVLPLRWVAGPALGELALLLLSLPVFF